MSRTRIERRKSSSTRWKNGLLCFSRWIKGLWNKGKQYCLESNMYNVHIGTSETMTGIHI